MGWFKRHPILSAVIPFIVLTVPSAIDAYWDLYQKFKGVSMPSLNLGIAIWVLPLVGLAFTVIIIWQLRYNKQEHQSLDKPQIQKTGSAMADTLTSQEREILKQVAYDRFHLKERLVVRNEKLLLWRPDNVMGGELRFEFEVFNGSIFPSVKVGCSIDGYLMVEGTRFHDKTEIQSSVNIVHGCWNNVVIIQRVLPEVIKEIRDGASKPGGIILRFDFEGVKIYAEEEGSKQGLNQQNILSLPKTMKFRVKHEADLYSWQPLYDTNIL